MRSKPTKVLPFDGLESENFEWMWSAIGEPPGSFPHDFGNFGAV